MERDTIFISHSRLDRDFAQRLASDLKKHGLSVWLDVLAIEPSAAWRSSLQEALGSCSQLAVLWSEASVHSAEVLSEVITAKLQGKLILQVMIDNCKPPSMFDEFQNIDFRNSYVEGLGRLLEFLPSGRRSQRVKELAELLPANPYPGLPKLKG